VVKLGNVAVAPAAAHSPSLLWLMLAAAAAPAAASSVPQSAVHEQHQLARSTAAVAAAAVAAQPEILDWKGKGVYAYAKAASPVAKVELWHWGHQGCLCWQGCLFWLCPPGVRGSVEGCVHSARSVLLCSLTLLVWGSRLWGSRWRGIQGPTSRAAVRRKGE